MAISWLNWNFLWWLFKYLGSLRLAWVVVVVAVVVIVMVLTGWIDANDLVVERRLELVILFGQLHFVRDGLAQRLVILTASQMISSDFFCLIRLVGWCCYLQVGIRGGSSNLIFQLHLAIFHDGPFQFSNEKQMRFRISSTQVAVISWIWVYLQRIGYGQMANIAEGKKQKRVESVGCCHVDGLLQRSLKAARRWARPIYDASRFFENNWDCSFDNNLILCQLQPLLSNVLIKWPYQMSLENVTRVLILVRLSYRIIVQLRRSEIQLFSWSVIGSQQQGCVNNVPLIKTDYL